MDHDLDHAIFFNKVKKARESLNGLTKEERKLAISFLQQTLDLEEDAAETTTVNLEIGDKNFITQIESDQKKARPFSANSKEAGEIFEGMSFKYPPASKEDYINAYDEYVRRCSS